jgi:hypothetical protein
MSAIATNLGLTLVLTRLPTQTVPRCEYRSYQADVIGLFSPHFCDGDTVILVEWAKLLGPLLLVLQPIDQDLAAVVQEFSMNRSGQSLLVIILVGVIWLVSSFAELASELCGRA